MPLKHTVEEIILDNGAKGLIIDVPDSTVVSYCIHFRAGNDYADRSKQQTAHLMEHMAFGPNARFASVEAFSQEFKKNGAYSNAITFDRSMNYVAESAAMEFGRILDLMELSITKPKHMQVSLDAEKGNVHEELISNTNDHGRVMWQYIWKAMGGNSLLDRDRIKTIDNVKLSDIKKHHRKTHTLQNMRFTLSGDLLKHRDLIINKLNRWDLPVGSRLPVLSRSYNSSPLVHIHRKELSQLLFGFNMSINRELSPSEQATMGALNHILTGTHHSRILGKARSLGICYGMGSGFDADISGNSSWNVYGRVGFENAAALFELIAHQISKVIAGDISARELSEAKQYAIGGYQMRAQTVGSLSSWYSGEYFDNETIDHIELSPKRIKSTTRKSMIRLAKEFIDKGCWTLGGIGNITEEQLQSHYDTLAQLFKAKEK